MRCQVGCGHYPLLLSLAPFLLVQAGGLGEYLSDPSQLFMVFAPDNIAWNSFFEGAAFAEAQKWQCAQLCVAWTPA